MNIYKITYKTDFATKEIIKSGTSSLSALKSLYEGNSERIVVIVKVEKMV